MVIRDLARKRFALLGLLLAILGVRSHAQQTVWQLGQFDDSSREFHDSFSVDYSSVASDVNYTIGRSSVHDWMRFQPGPANGLAGGREHPFSIHFNLPTVPAGSYTLRVTVLYETPRRSALRLNVNGHQGVFYFHPTLDYAAGDWEGTFVPQTSHAVRLIQLPAAWLRQGGNTFTLVAVDTPSAPVNALGDIAPGISGIVYDAISLEHSATAAQATGTASAEPTLFFRKTSAGLSEIVTACASVPGGAAVPPAVALRMHGLLQSQATDAAMQFGDLCADFEVPEWTGTLHAEVLLGTQSFPFDLAAQKKWTVAIVPHEHLDIGFTDFRAKVAELQSQSLDGVLDMLPAHPEFRWTMDGSWVAQQFIAARSPQRVDQLMQAVRRGQIVLPAQYANQHTGVASLEGLARSLYPSQAIARRYDVPVGAANITDVPSYSWSYASILHDAGIQYFAAGSNSWRAPILLLGRWNEKSPFYWQGPDGGKVLMWYSRAYLQTASMFGVSPQVAAVHDALPVFLQAYSRPDYRADLVILFGSQLENTVLDAGQVTLPAQWAAQYAYPQLRFSTFAEAMANIESQFGKSNIKTYRGDFGPYWEDGFASGSMATAQHRANQQRILNAEKMATVPALLDRNLRPDEAFLADAWQNMLLFDEHTWTCVCATTAPESDEAVRQIALKKQEPTLTASAIEQTVQRSWAQMASFLSPHQDSIAVFNPLSWQRSAWVESDLGAGQQIVDAATGKPVTQWLVRKEKGRPLAGFGGTTNRVRWQAADLPSLGYKLFAVAQGNAAQPAVPAATARQTLENRYYRVQLDPATAAIRSIWDKQLQRELVDGSSQFRMASYVYVTGADDIPNNSLYRYGAALPRPVLVTNPAQGGRLISIKHSREGQTAVMEAHAVNTPGIRTEILLPDDARRIDISIKLQKDPTLKKESAYIAFPIAMPQPSFAYDTQTGWVDPANDELAGGSREWYATQHWAAVHSVLPDVSKDSSVAIVPLDAPLVNFGDIVRGAWPTEFNPKSSTIFSWLMSNYWNTNFPAEQGGDFTFRYSLVSARSFDPAELERFALQQMTAVETSRVAARSGNNSLPGLSASFLASDNPEVLVGTWKLAEDGQGSIVRLVEIGGKDSATVLHSPVLKVTAAMQCSLLEKCNGDLPIARDGIHLLLHAYQTLTLRLSMQALPAIQTQVLR